MDLNHLHAFCTVVESGSISEAARKIFVSQPSISTKISELEKHFQTTLLERTNKGVKPTEQGLFLYHEGQKILSMTKNLEHGLGLANEYQSEVLHIGASETIGSYLLPCRVIQYHELYPNFKINLTIEESNQIIMKMQNSAIDFGFLEGPLHSRVDDRFTKNALELEKIGEEELVIAVSKNIKSSKSNMDWAFFKELPLIMISKGTAIHSTIEKSFEEKGFSIDELNIVMEVNRINAAISAVVANKGFTILPRSVFLNEDILQLSVNELSFKHEYHLVYNKANTKRDSMRFFLNLFLDNGIEGLCWNICPAS